MSRYIMIRRLRGPAFLLLVGVNALLAESHILGWWQSWPFYLILAGALLLAERAALAAEGYPMHPASPYAGANRPGATPTAAGQGSPSAAATESAIVPTRLHDFDNEPNGGER